MKRPLRIPDRVRLTGSSALGTVFANQYVHRGTVSVGVIWDDAPTWLVSVEASQLVLVESEPVGVPIEARPYSVGALMAPERRF